MKNILFSHSYFLRYDLKQWQTAQPYAPLGTLYAAALMRNQGHIVSLFDTMFAYHPEELTEYLKKYRPSIFIIYDDGFNYLTKMCLTNMREAAFKMIRLAKEYGCEVIVSSSDSTDRFELYLEEGADFILTGEAEMTLLELIKEIDSPEKDLFKIQGLAFKHHESIVKTPRRNVIKDLDSLPFPAWDLVNVEHYREIWVNKYGYFSMNMGTTRGCPFKCNWCAKPIYGNRYNCRSPYNVVSELIMLKKHYNPDHIWFCDDIFGLKPGWVKEFAELLDKENLRFKFKIQSRVDLLLHENTIKNLEMAGCDTIWMGAESGSQKILDAMDKGTTVEQIYEATHLIKKHGMRPSFFIQFGYLGETWEDIEKTIRMINKLMPAEIGISVSYPLPGTLFYEKVKSQLKEKANWTDSDELALMFRNTYQPFFYKQLHRYVHLSYRQHIAFANLKNLLMHPLQGKLSMFKRVLSGIYYLPAAFLGKQKLNKLARAGI